MSDTAGQKKLHKPPSRWPLLIIALDKLVKAVGLVVVAFFLKKLLAPETHQQIQDWLDNARLEPHNWFIHGYVLDTVGNVLGIEPRTLRLLHVGVIVYAGLYLIEGVGLIFDKKWAEWVVVASTAMFLPLEIYEITQKVNWPRCLLFAGNLGMALYLVWRLRRQAVIRRERG